MLDAKLEVISKNIMKNEPSGAFIIVFVGIQRVIFRIQKGIYDEAFCEKSSDIKLS